jgi:hypothetical protein
MEYENTGLPLVLLIEQAGVFFGIPFGATSADSSCCCHFANLTQTLSEQTMDKELFQRNINVARINADGSTDNVTPDSDISATLKETILENAHGPKRVQGDSGSVEQHSLQDLIAAERFLQSKKAVQSKGLGIRFLKISSDGTV